MLILPTANVWIRFATSIEAHNEGMHTRRGLQALSLQSGSACVSAEEGRFSHRSVRIRPCRIIQEANPFSSCLITYCITIIYALT